VSGGVGSDGNLVVVGTPKGEVIALMRVGQVKWRVSSMPRCRARRFGWHGGGAQCRQPPVRPRRLRRQAPLDVPAGHAALALRNAAGVVLEGNAIIAGFRGQAGGVNGANGSLMWEGTAVPRGATELERVADITSLPVMTPAQPAPWPTRGGLPVSTCQRLHPVDARSVQLQGP
jgi:outer membrane protein assembly factor BamB